MSRRLPQSAVSSSVLAEDAIVVIPTKSPKAIGGVTRGTHPHPVLVEDVIVTAHDLVLYEDSYNNTTPPPPTNRLRGSWWG